MSDLAINRATTAVIVRGDVEPQLVSPADPIIARMIENQDITHRVVLARQAIRLDPGCVPAHLYLAGCAPTLELKFAHLQAAVESGEAIWRPVAEQYGDGMLWWSFFHTRPYMKALKALGDTHLEVGNEQAARGCFELLVRMNPSDNQFIGEIVRPR
jgi:hypothetical protein